MNRKPKSILATLLAVVMAVSLLPTAAFAEDLTGTIGSIDKVELKMQGGTGNIILTLNAGNTPAWISWMAYDIDADQNSDDAQDYETAQFPGNKTDLDNAVANFEYIFGGAWQNASYISGLKATIPLTVPNTYWGKEMRIAILTSINSGAAAGLYTSVTLDADGNTNDPIEKQDLKAADFTVSGAVNYNGDPQAPTVTGPEGCGTITVKLGTDGTANKTDANTYAVKIAVAEGTKYKATTTDLDLGTWKINKINPTVNVTAPAANSEYTSGTKLSDIAITGSATGAKGATVAGTLAWTNGNDTITANGNKGWTFTVTGADATNYNNATGNVALKVKAAQATTIELGKTSDTYTGSDLKPTVTVKAGGTTIDASNYNTPVWNPATVVNAGTYTVSVTMKNTAVYSNPANATFTINPKKLATPAVPTEASKTSNSITLTTITPPTGGKIQYSKDGTTWQDSPTFTGLNANTGYTFYAKAVKTSNNYADSDSSAASATITTPGGPSYTIEVNNPGDFTAVDYDYAAPAAKTVTFTNKGNQVQTITVAATGDTTAFDVTGTGANADVAATTGTVDVTVTPKAGLNAGTYSITLKATSANNTTGASKTIQFTVNQKELTAGNFTGPTAFSQITYNGNTDVPAGNVTTGLTKPAGVTAATVEYTRANANAGTGVQVNAKVTAVTSTNYKLPAGGLTLTNVGTIDVDKANPTGAPTFPTISEAGKTLADGKPADATGIKDVAGNDMTGGTFAWDAPNTDATEIVRGTSYAWTYTPADTTNYNTLTGTKVLWANAGGGGGGGGSSAYTVTYKAGDHGKLTGNTAERAERGDSLKKVPTVTADDGYTFLGWSEDGKTIIDVKTYKVTKSVTLTALYEEVEVLKPELNKVDHMAYIRGYEDGTFRGQNSITRAEVAAILSRIMTDSMIEGQTYSSSFNDVASNAWYANYIGFMERYGVLTGYEDGSFRPNAAITREEFVAMVTRMEEVTSGGSVPFPDVDRSMWSYDNIAAAYAKGWVTGYGEEEGNVFRPKQNISRYEAVAIVNRMLERFINAGSIEGKAPVIFGDVPTDYWAYYPVIEASNGHDYTKDDNGVDIWD